jgi:hypothetical protein
MGQAEYFRQVLTIVSQDVAYSPAGSDSRQHQRFRGNIIAADMSFSRLLSVQTPGDPSSHSSIAR